MTAAVVARARNVREGDLVTELGTVGPWYPVLGWDMDRLVVDGRPPGDPLSLPVVLPVLAWDGVWVWRAVAGADDPGAG